MPNRGEPLETCCATRLLRCAVLGILMYVYVHCGSCAPCALHSGRSLRFQEVPRSSDAVGNMRCSRAMATRYRIAFGQYSLAAPNHSHSQAALMTQLAITSLG